MLESIRQTNWSLVFSGVRGVLGGLTLLLAAWALVSGTARQRLRFARTWGLDAATTAALFRPAYPPLRVGLLWLAAAPLAATGLAAIGVALVDQPLLLMKIVLVMLAAVPVVLALVGLELLLAAPAFAYGQRLALLKISDFPSAPSVAEIKATLASGPPSVSSVRLSAVVIIAGAIWVASSLAGHLPGVDALVAKVLAGHHQASRP